MEKIRTPFYTAKVLSNLGLIDENKIKSKESINVMRNQTNANEIIIFECFDEMIKKDWHIKDFLSEFRDEFAGMPY